MKKEINIKIICETDTDNDKIRKVLHHNVYRALDTSPNYIAAPKEVEMIKITITNAFEHSKSKITFGK